MAKLVKDLARLDNSRVDDAIKDIEAGAPGLDETIMAHKREVLGQIGLRELGYLEKILDAGLLELEDIQYFEAF